MGKNIYPLLLFTIFALTGFFPARAAFHGNSLEGVVKESATGEPIAGATVMLEPGGQGRVTDYQGRFSFGILPAGSYSVRVRGLGYVPDTLTTQVVAGKVSNLVFSLTTTSINLGQVEIVASRENDFTAVSSLDIALRPVLSSQEVLRQVPGLFIGQHAGGGKAEQIFLRGYDLDHGTDIAIGVDGMPVNMVSHAHGQGYADLHFLIPELIEGVEFGKGPYATSQGNFATAGYVQFRTQNELKQNMVKTELGSFGTIRNLAMVNLGGAKMKAANQSWYLAAEQLASRGYFVSPQDFGRMNLLSKYRIHMGHHHVFTLTASTFSSRWLASGQIPDRAVASGLISRFGAIDDNEGGSTSRSNVNAELQTFTAEGGVLKNQLYYSRYAFDLFSNFTFYLNDPVNGDQIRQREKRNLIGYRGSYTRSLNLLGRNLVTSAGAGLRTDFVNDMGLSHTLSRNITLMDIQRGDVREWNADAWLDGQWEITRKLNLGTGIRYDQMGFEYHDRKEVMRPSASVNRGILNPKVRLQYSPSSNVKFYIKTGSGFHSNDTRVVTDTLATAVLPRVWGADVGALLKPAPGVLIHIALWAMHSQTEFVYVGDEGVVEAGGRSQRLGADASLRWQLSQWLYADADLNWTRPRSVEAQQGQSFIPLAPTFSSTGGLTLNPWPRLKGSIRYRWLGDRPANEDYSLNAKGYCLLDAQVTYTWGMFDFTLSAVNLLNTEWKETQFETTSRLNNEPAPVTEIHFTPGTPLALKLGVAAKF